MRKFTSFIILLISFYLANAQNDKAIIKGKILYADSSPAFVSVQLKNNLKMTVTNEKGEFILKNLHAIHDTLLITAAETQTLSLPVLLKTNKTLDLGIIKQKALLGALQDIEIKGRNTNTYKSDYSFFGSKTETPIKDLPQSISTITKELIKDKMELSLKDVVGDIAGVNQYSGFDEYTIRGFRAENPRDINGLRGYNTTYNSSLLVNIERVEVIKGPTATLYGNCDPGGTINMVTKKPLENKHASIDVYGGSWSHFRTLSDITGPLNKSKNLLYRFNAGYDDSHSFRNEQHTKSFELAPSFTFIKNDKLEMSYDFSISHVNTVLDWGQLALSDGNLKSTPVSLSLSQPGDYLKETDIASDITLSYKFNNNFSFNTGYLFYNTSQSVGNHGFNGYIVPDSIYLYYTSWKYHTHTNTISSYFTYKCNTKNISHVWVFGYDFIRSKVDLHQQYYEQPGQFGASSGIVGTFSLSHPQYIQRPVNTYQKSDFDQDLTDVDGNIYHTNGLYAQDFLSYKKWNLLFSIRQEFYKGDTKDSIGSLAENVFLPRIGLVYKLKPNISVYASFNKGFDPFEASTGMQVFNNKVPFKPQISTVLETGAKGSFFNSRLFTSIALYQLTINNVAVNANDPANPNLFVQQGQEQSRGIELEAVGNISQNISLYTSYAYCAAKVTKSKIPTQVGATVPNAPRHESSSWIKYKWNKSLLKGFGIAFGHSQVSSRYMLDNATTLPGYLIFNGSISYKLKHFDFAINVYNVSNRVFWTSAYTNINKWPGAPRNIMMQIGYTF